MRNEYVAPDSDLERTVVGVMEKVLGIHPIGVTDSFGELGGDSLAAIGLIAELNSLLRSNLAVMDFYDRPTARDAASSIAAATMTRRSILEDRSFAETEAKKVVLRDRYLQSRRAGQNR